MNPFFGSVFWLLVTLGVLVTFHEFGHYWVARRCGVKVLRFSVGFGAALWKRVARDGTEYRVAAIPLGGYVKMLDAREGEVPAALAGQEFTSKPVLQRIAIVAAGPAFNLLFTVLAFWLVFTLGRASYAPIVTATPHSLAAQAGVQPGDRLLSIGGKAVPTLDDVFTALGDALLGREATPIVVRERDGTQKQLLLPLQKLPAGESVDRYMEQLGLQPAPPPAIAAVVEPGEPAALAGMRGGDRLLSVNGTPATDFVAFGQLVARDAARAPTLHIGIERDGKPLTLAVTAKMLSVQGAPPRWMIGIAAPPPEAAVQRYSPLGAMRAALAMTRDGVDSIFTMIGKIVSGRASSKNLSGVVGIAQIANASASAGPTSFIEFLGLISLNLAVLNLLPIPLLDGGQLLYYLIELVKGSPVNERIVVASQYAGLALLFGLLGLTFYNDIHRLVLPA